MASRCISNASWHKNMNPGHDCMYQDTHRNTQTPHRATSPEMYTQASNKMPKRESKSPLKGREAAEGGRQLTHLWSGWQSGQWVWEARPGAAWEGTAASLGSPHGLQRKQQVFWGAVAGLVWLKDLGTGGLQTHWQRDSLQTLKGQPHDTQKTLHERRAGGAGRGQPGSQDRDVGSTSKTAEHQLL